MQNFGGKQGVIMIGDVQMAIGISLKIMYKQEINQESQWMFLCKNGTDTNIYNNKSDNEDNDDDDDDEKRNTQKRSVHTYFLPTCSEAD